MSTHHPTHACDCLNWCGDDPAVQAGRARPCEHRQKALDEAERQRAALAHLNTCAKQVTAWLTAGADPQSIPREQIAATAAFVISRTEST